MALIIMTIDGMNGDATLEGHEGDFEAVGMRDAIEVGISASQSSSGASAAGGGLARARHANIQVMRYRDSGSPKLVQACAGGMNIGNVTLRLFRVAETGSEEYMRYTLTDTIIARVEYDTLDTNGTAFQPHLAVSSRGLPLDGAVGLGTLIGPLVASSTVSQRAVAQPLTGVPRGMAESREVERLWLNANTVTWTYTPFVGGLPGGVVEKGYDVLLGRAL